MFRRRIHYSFNSRVQEISSLSDVDMAKKLVVDHKLASIPISVFYHANLDEHFLRFCFAKKEETLKRAGDILINL